MLFPSNSEITQFPATTYHNCTRGSTSCMGAYVSPHHARGDCQTAFCMIALASFSAYEAQQTAPPNLHTLTGYGQKIFQIPLVVPLHGRFHNSYCCRHWPGFPLRAAAFPWRLELGMYSSRCSSFRKGDTHAISGGTRICDTFDGARAPVLFSGKGSCCDLVIREHGEIQ